MIWVLAQDDRLHPVKWTKIECIENEAPGWINCIVFVFIPDKFRKPDKIILLKLTFQPFLPGVFNLYIHFRCC